MARAVKPRATYEDVLRAPAHKVAEIIDGELGSEPATGRTASGRGGRARRGAGPSLQARPGWARRVDHPR